MVVPAAELEAWGAAELEAWGAAELEAWGAAELMALSSTGCAAVAVARMDEGVPMMVLAEQWG